MCWTKGGIKAVHLSCQISIKENSLFSLSEVSKCSPFCMLTILFYWTFVFHTLAFSHLGSWQPLEKIRYASQHDFGCTCILTPSCRLKEWQRQMYKNTVSLYWQVLWFWVEKEGRTGEYWRCFEVFLFFFCRYWTRFAYWKGLCHSSQREEMWGPRFQKVLTLREVSNIGERSRLSWGRQLIVQTECFGS